MGRDAGAENQRVTEVATTGLPDRTAQRPGSQNAFPLPAPRPRHHACHRLKQRREVQAGPDAPDAEGTGNQAALGDVGS